jgi:four helix bundle protein
MLDFRKLDAYRYAVALLELVSTLVDEIPAPQRCLGECLGRAALALLRSLAEGSHRQPSNRAEARHCYAVARVSAFECVGLVDTLDRVRAVAAEDAARTREVLSRLVAMLSRLEAEATGEHALAGAGVP